MNLERHSFEFETKFSADTPGSFSGYGSVFGIMDLGGDIMMPGAFTDTLKDWKKRKGWPAMLWQHDTREPVGVWNKMTEDEKGLAMDGDLILEVPKAQTAYALMKRRAVTGLSIGYRTKDYEMDRKTGARRLKKVDLFEVSLVTSPMLPEAQISTVKTGLALLSDRELEAMLRDEARLSNRDAKAAVAVFRKALRDEGNAPPEPRDEADADAFARALAVMAERLRS